MNSMTTHEVNADPRRTARRSARAFTSAVRALERAALVPIMPGELSSWIKSVAEALDRVRAAFTKRHRGYRAIEREIVRFEPTLAHRVERLSRRAEEEGAELKRLTDRIGAIREQLDTAPAAMERARARRLRNEILMWSVNARALDAEVDAWFSESIYRDLGVPN